MVHYPGSDPPGAEKEEPNMKCQFCNAKIHKDAKVCPACGKRVNGEKIPKAFSQMKSAAIGVGCIAGLSALAVVLFIAMQTGWDLGSSFDWLKPRVNDLYYKDSYTVSDWKAQRKRNDVVATMGDAQLTNGQLQVYYWMQVYEFVENYSDTAISLELDYTADLAKQIYTDGKTTWQQFFLESALEMWMTNQAFALQAQEVGYTLPAAYQSYLDNLDAELAKDAAELGYASAEDMIRGEMGAGCSLADYTAYMQVYYTGYLYFTDLYGKINPTEQEISDYFDANATSFAKSGVTKTSGNYVDVRHILLVPSADTETAWAECRSRVDAVLQKWQNSDMTELDFLVLVEQYSQDDITAYTGGMYTNIAKGDMEEAFENWCFAENRQAGDWGLVQTSYGYHLLYFVEAEAIWHAEAKTALIQAQGRDLVDGVLAQYALDVDYRKIVLAEVEMG